MSRVGPRGRRAQKHLERFGRAREHAARGHARRRARVGDAAARVDGRAHLLLQRGRLHALAHRADRRRHAHSHRELARLLSA
eukprot:2558831-Prymnesium_polylepis.1